MAVPGREVHPSPAGVPGGGMTVLPEALYRGMAEALPILCVDVILRNRKGDYLLLKRVNEPKKGRWWPVGGRVRKGESLPTAAIRKVKEETGLSTRALQPVGYFEYHGRRGPLGIDTGYHSVSVVFLASVGDRKTVVLDGQSSAWKYAERLPADFRVVTFPGAGSRIPVWQGGMPHPRSESP